MLKSTIETIEEVDEAFRPHYKVAPAGTKGFVLDLDDTPTGFTPNAEPAANANKVVEFRNNNIALIKEVEELRPLKTKFSGIDPIEAKAAIDKVKELKVKGVTKPDDVENLMSAMLKKFTEDVVDPLKTELATEKTARTTADQAVATATMRTQLGEKFLKIGGEPGALSFILTQAEDSFHVVDGHTVAKENVFSTDSPGSALEPDEWLKHSATAPATSFAFKTSNGGGSEGDKPTSGFKPGAKVLVDPTPAQLGANMDAIANGTVVVNSSQRG